MREFFIEALEPIADLDHAARKRPPAQVHAG
jgi:hypothetical protein